MFISIEYSPDDFDVVKLPDCRNYEIEQLQNDFFHGCLTRITIINIGAIAKVKKYIANMIQMHLLNG